MGKSLRAYDVDDRSFARAKSCWLRLLLILSISLFGDGKAICQVGFNKLISPQLEGSLDIDDILFHEDRIIARGNYYSDSLNLWGVYLASLDTNGIILWDRAVFDSAGASHIISNTPAAFSILSNGNIILPCHFFNYNKMGLFVFDSIGKVIHSENYHGSGHRTIFGKDVKQVSSNNYIVGVVQTLNYLSDVYVLKTDLAGNKIWLKFYGVEALYEEFGDVMVNGDSTLTISAGRFNKDFYGLHSVGGWKRPWIFTIDTSGEIINEWLGEENDERTLGGRSFLRMRNGDWVVVSAEYQECEFPFGTYVCTAPTISRMDSNFTLLWKTYLADYTHPFDEFVDLEYDSTRDEFIAGGLRVAYYQPNLETPVAWAAKLKSTGEIVWSKSDTIISDLVHGVRVFTAGMDISPSASIYLAGNAEHLLNPVKYHTWIIKITPDGCMDTLCTTTSILDQIEKRNKNVYLYPNPADGFFKIHIKDLKGAGKLSIFDLQGRLMLSESVNEGDNHVDVEVLHGLYMYSVLDDGQMIGYGKVVIR